MFPAAFRVWRNVPWQDLRGRIMFPEVKKWMIMACLLTLLGGDAWAAVGLEMARMIEALASPVFSERQQAAKDLTHLGGLHFGEIKTALADAYRNSADPEVRLMSQEILTGLFVSRRGFLGVQYGACDFINAAGKTQLVITILGVQPNTAAAKGGLRVGDLIISLNGKSFGDAVLAEWATQIKAVPPGSPVTLMISRQGKHRQLKLKVGSWPYPPTASEQRALFKQRISEIPPLAPPEG
jgi:membrane-associated protease RseP (regulator of RpoE activity)